MSDFTNIYTQLKKVLKTCSANLECIQDSDQEYSLNTHYKLKNKKNLWFGAVQIKKNYVSFHLMPLYLNPALIQKISPELKKKMQGKSCFNFSKPDPHLFSELSQITKLCYSYYKDSGYI